MPDARYEAHRTDKATLDANGNGTITLYPEPRWEQWTVDYVRVRTNQPPGTTPVPQADWWLNDPSVVDNHQGGTRDGDLDTGRGRVLLEPDDTLVITFTGGRPGDIAYATAWGYYTRPVSWPGTGA